MTNRDPSFEINNEIINRVVEIAELVGRLNANLKLTANHSLHWANRMRTIHGTLAIEQNILSLEQVTAILNGKHVLAPPKDVAEVKNTYKIYNRMEELDPYLAGDLLDAHATMTQGLVKESGVFRTQPVGVVDYQGLVLHLGAKPQYVPNLVMELLDWTKNSPIHMLIRSCVFHYELELIHPFADGNGRMGRLWQTLLLSRWNSAFAWLPLEDIIYRRQKEYYDVISSCNDAGTSTAFIEFMLSAIGETLLGVIENPTEKFDIKQLRREKIENFLQTHESIMNSDVQQCCSVSPATANRILRDFTEQGKLEKYHINGHWAYKRTGK